MNLEKRKKLAEEITELANKNAKDPKILRKMNEAQIRYGSIKFQDYYKKINI